MFSTPINAVVHESPFKILEELNKSTGWRRVILKPHIQQLRDHCHLKQAIALVQAELDYCRIATLLNVTK